MSLLGSNQLSPLYAAEQQNAAMMQQMAYQDQMRLLAQYGQGGLGSGLNIPPDADNPVLLLLEAPRTT